MGESGEIVVGDNREFLVSQAEQYRAGDAEEEVEAPEEEVDGDGGEDGEDGEGEGAE